MANGDDDLDCIELDDLLGERLLLEEDFEELGAANEWHHKVKPHVILEQVVHAD